MILSAGHEAIGAKMYDKVCTSVHLGQQNSIQLNRVMTRLEMIEDKLQSWAPASSASDVSYTSSANMSMTSNDVGAFDHLAGLVPCSEQDELKELDVLLKDNANRNFMVRIEENRKCA